MKHSISPYPANVVVNAAKQVFRDGKYLGYVDVVPNWGTNFLARPEAGLSFNKFFATQTEAIKHILKVQPL